MKLACLVTVACVWYSVPTAFSQVKMQRQSAQTGVLQFEGRLLRTESNGRTWVDITPPPSFGDHLDGAYFVDSQVGWAILSGPSVQVAMTSDGGATWIASRFDVMSADDLRAYGGQAFPQFTDRLHGWILLVRASTANFSLGNLYATSDGGATWARLPDPPIAAEPRFFTAVDGWLTGGVRDDEQYLTHDGGRTWSPSALSIRSRVPAPFGLRMGQVVLQSAFVDPADGWYLVSAGRCEGFKIACVQETFLYGTADGGKTVANITPLIRRSRPRPILISTAEGFDKCTAEPLANMAAWWHTSPYTDVNIYIGGSSRACSQANLTSAWVSQILAFGWRLVPTWVGPQAPCNNFSHRISTDPVTAEAQGAAEADAAANAAAQLGLFDTIIYYDLEYYDQTNNACDASVRSFVNGWVRQLHFYRILGAAYGSPYDLPGWATVDHPPDAVWVAKWDNRDTVWGLSPLSDSLWANQARLHQYMGAHNETWAGVAFNIDRSVASGPVAISPPAYMRVSSR